MAKEIQAKSHRMRVELIGPEGRVEEFVSVAAPEEIAKKAMESARGLVDGIRQSTEKLEENSSPA